jgi:uncharacterized protein
MPDPMGTTPIALSPKPGPVKRLFVGPHGIRALWSVVIFAGLMMLAAIAWVHLVIYVGHLGSVLNPPKFNAFLNGTAPAMTPSGVALPAFMLVVPVLVATSLMGLIERRAFWSYGFGDRRALRHAGAGLLWGFVALSMLVGLLVATGHLAFDGVTESAPLALRYAVLWSVVFLMVGLFEESLSRGYVQATVTRGIGFWPAAVLLSVLFGSAHYGNPGETAIGLAGAGAAGLVFCYSLWRSGSLWWAIGFHTSWDWAQSYFYGTHDSGTLSRGRLLASHPVGADWLSGGTVGPEGSIMVFAVLLAVMVVIHRTLTPPPGGPYPPTTGPVATSVPIAIDPPTHNA